jgi:hypothetical protein
MALKNPKVSYPAKIKLKKMMMTVTPHFLENVKLLEITLNVTPAYFFLKNTMHPFTSMIGTDNVCSSWRGQKVGFKSVEINPSLS